MAEYAKVIEVTGPDPEVPPARRLAHTLRSPMPMPKEFPGDFVVYPEKRFAGSLEDVLINALKQGMEVRVRDDWSAILTPIQARRRANGQWYRWLVFYPKGDGMVSRPRMVDVVLPLHYPKIPAASFVCEVCGRIRAERRMKCIVVGMAPHTVSTYTVCDCCVVKAVDATAAVGYYVAREA